MSSSSSGDALDKDWNYPSRENRDASHDDFSENSIAIDEIQVVLAS